MKDLRAIARPYERIDGFLKDLRKRHDAAGEIEERDRIAREQEINDQAYFVLAWSQLEADIDAACRDAIRHGQAHGAGFPRPPTAIIYERLLKMGSTGGLYQQLRSDKTCV